MNNLNWVFIVRLPLGNQMEHPGQQPAEWMMTYLPWELVLPL